ncbi:hypothetical protein [Streptomyces sp. NPDC085540]|uniref:hypothetical protein n=1 Tax=Streptomyces sp. NPDC085540 TaxID=3365730 RepID=UPI0037CD4E70
MTAVAEETSGRGKTYELAYDLATEIERHHDLRTSPWNTPDDVGPEDERELSELLASLRMFTSSDS